MKIYTKIHELKEYLRRQQQEGKSIGLVPTMGSLHEGHLSLIKSAVSENQIVVVSIFVNPTQFGPNEDFERYPRAFEKDSELCLKAGAGVIFHPPVKEIYPEGYCSYVDVEGLTNSLCGADRPGHFKGVTTIVTKLFNIVRPDRAYFGRKDAQQAIVIQRMVKDLDMDTSIVVCPIIREADGLAMSSRNVYLNKDERTQALILNKSLEKARQLIGEGETDSRKIKSVIKGMISAMPLAEIDYISVVDTKTLEAVEMVSGKILVALAVKFGKTRLIDNIIMEV